MDQFTGAFDQKLALFDKINQRNGPKNDLKPRTSNEPRRKIQYLQAQGMNFFHAQRAGET